MHEPEVTDSPPAQDAAAENRPRDLTQGPLVRTVISMGVPSAIGFSAQIAFTLVNLFWVGRLGTDAIAGVTVFSALLYVLWSFNEMIGAGSVPIISRRLGEHDFAEASVAIYQTLFFKFAMATVVGIAACALTGPLVHMMNARGDVAAQAIAYGRLASLTLPLLYCMVSIWTVLRSAGRASTAMMFMLGSVGLNMVLDPLFMLVLGLGVRGAAIANGITNLIFLLAGVAYLQSGRAGFRLPVPPPRPWIRWDVVGSIVRIGFPATVESMSRSFSLTWCVSRVALYGSAAVAATGIAQRLVDMGTVVGVGFTLGTIPIVGQCLGAGKPERARRAVLVATAISAGIVAPVVIAELLAAGPLVRLFDSGGHAHEIGKVAVRIMAPLQLLLAIQLPLAAAFWGSGNTLSTMVLGVTFGAGGTVALVLAAEALGFHSPMVVWGAILAAYSMELAGFVLWFRRGSWMKAKI
ncbi:MAG: MATE family efflux transporter [Candidatus Eisenbacteria bacterium]|nr:MATE family efflux transporter [Candidatus Eisenbacteria bacterium]